MSDRYPGVPKNWAKISKGDVWGKVYYTYFGEHLDELGMPTVEHKLLLPESAHLKVKWPDGTVQTTLLRSREVTKIIEGQGYYEPVKSMEWGFLVNVKGIDFWVDLSCCEIKAGKFQRASEVTKENDK